MEQSAMRNRRSRISFPATEAALTPVFSLNCSEWEYPHAVIDHAKEHYVIGAVHTQTIERFWSIIKRGVVGTFHKVSKKYMPLYVAEFQFRYNNRLSPDIFGTAISGG
jgi:hypothetical protein